MIWNPDFSVKSSGFCSHIFNTDSTACWIKQAPLAALHLFNHDSFGHQYGPGLLGFSSVALSNKLTFWTCCASDSTSTIVQSGWALLSLDGCWLLFLEETWGMACTLVKHILFFTIFVQNHCCCMCIPIFFKNLWWMNFLSFLIQLSFHCFPYWTVDKWKNGNKRKIFLQIEVCISKF